MADTIQYNPQSPETARRIRVDRAKHQAKDMELCLVGPPPLQKDEYCHKEPKVVFQVGTSGFKDTIYNVSLIVATDRPSMHCSCPDAAKNKCKHQILVVMKLLSSYKDTQRQIFIDTGDFDLNTRDVAEILIRGFLLPSVEPTPQPAPPTPTAYIMPRTEPTQRPRAPKKKYIITRTGAKYHSDKDCYGLRNAAQLFECSKHEASDKGLKACSICCSKSDY